MADAAQALSSSQKTYSASLSTEDLIHPHKASDIPGYIGHTPQLKFNCGHTYGYHTDVLSKRHMRNEKLIHTRPDFSIDLKRAYLPRHVGDNKYFEKMIPGYTGYVPGHHFGFGTTYKEGTEIAVAKFKSKDHQRRVELLGLNTKAATNQPLKVSASYPPPDISHPGTNLRYTNAYYRKKFSDRKEFTESPIPGYTGFVPKKQEYELGSTYGTWSGKAYVDALATKKMQENTSMLPIEVKRSFQSMPMTSTVHGNIYKPIGMVPKYTGYVPNRRFEIGNTYGDTTRLLPVCHDTPGYATGKYNYSGPPIRREVIPA